MGLDTRGFMDGALRGFDMMDRYQTRKANQARQARLDEQNEQRYQDRQTRLRDLDERDETRYQERKDRDQQRYADNQARLKANDKLTQERTKASIQANESAQALNQWKLQNQQRQAWLNENTPLIAAANDRYIESGGKDVDPILENEFIKGGANDIRSYTGEMFEAANQLETVLPKVMQGEVGLSDPAFVQPLGKMFENRIKVGIGDKDETGKVIQDKALSHVTNVADIDPNTPGDQPGMVLGLTVTYEDGSQAVKPVTQNRSTAGDDTPLVIPVEAAMQNITQRLAKAKALNLRMSHPERYKQMLENQEKYKDAVYQNEQKRVELKSDEFNPQSPEEVDESIAQLNQAAQVRYDVAPDGQKKQNLSPAEQVSQWAGADANKQRFLAEVQSRRFNVNSVPVERLDGIYKAWLQNSHKSQVAQSLREGATTYANR